MHDLIILIQYIGLFVFAITGAAVAKKAEYDFFGMLFLAFITAVGGGTVRDIILNQTVFWTVSSWSLSIIFMACLMTMLFHQFIERLQKVLFLFDTIGLGIFAISGTEQALSLGCSVETSLVMGVISGVLGGVLRSVFNNEIPIIFKKEIYATTAAIASGTFILLIKLEVSSMNAIIITMILSTLVRYLSVRYRIHMPNAS